MYEDEHLEAQYEDRYETFGNAHWDEYMDDNFDDEDDE